MHKRNFLLVLFSLFILFATAQKKDKKLESQLQALMKGHNGTVGIYVKNLKTGKTAAYNQDTIFPTASMIKIPILIGIMDKINRGELSYHQELEYKDSLLYAGVDILGTFKTGTV